MIKGLPEKLKELRQKHGLSQRAVAKQLDLSTSIVSGYETGERTPSAEVLLALSYLYHCSTDYLLGRDSSTPTATINVDGLDAKQVQLISALVAELRTGF